MPMKQTGTVDLEQHNGQYRRVVDPYSGQEVVVVPALTPDVAIIHVQKVDANGNAQIWGIVGEQKEAAFASSRVIVTAEEIVDESVIRSDPNRTIIPGMVVDAVCHVPHCAHPSYTQGYYDRDNQFYLEWDALSADPEKLKAYLDEWVFGVVDRNEYWQKLGADTHQRLAVADAFSTPVNYGDY